MQRLADEELSPPPPSRSSPDCSCSRTCAIDDKREERLVNIELHLATIKNTLIGESLTLRQLLRDISCELWKAALLYPCLLFFIDCCRDWLDTMNVSFTDSGIAQLRVALGRYGHGTIRRSVVRMRICNTVY